MQSEVISGLFGLGGAVLGYGLSETGAGVRAFAASRGRRRALLVDYSSAAAEVVIGLEAIHDMLFRYHLIGEQVPPDHSGKFIERLNGGLATMITLSFRVDTECSTEAAALARRMLADAREVTSTLMAVSRSAEVEPEMWEKLHALGRLLEVRAGELVRLR